MPWRTAYLRTRSRKSCLAESSSKTWVELWLRHVQWLVEPRSTRCRRGMRATIERRTRNRCADHLHRDFWTLVMPVPKKGGHFRTSVGKSNVRHQDPPQDPPFLNRCLEVERPSPRPWTNVRHQGPRQGPRASEAPRAARGVARRASAGTTRASSGFRRSSEPARRASKASSRASTTRLRQRRRTFSRTRPIWRRW